VLAVIYGLKQIAEDGLALLSALAIVTGLAVGVMFVRRQRALADPLIDLRLFRVPAFSVSLATNIIGLFAALGAFLFVAQYLQLVLGLSPLQAGLWTAPSSGGLIVGSILAPAIVHRVGVRPAFVMAAGLVLAAVGFGVLTQVEGSSGLSVLVTGSVVFSLGIAPTVTLSTDLIVGTAPPERAGAASAMSETGTELGGALGIAILGSIGTAVYRSEVGEGVPAAVPSAAEAARDTLATALAVAEQLPEELGAALLGAAREAFTQGLRLTAAISAGIALGIAALAATLLRDVRGGSEAEERLETEPA
jgi:MFS transporter, DHA2 family, multidrug resistance protein